MTAYKKNQAQDAILYNAHIKVKSLFYFVLKLSLSNDNQIKSIFEIMQFSFSDFISAVFIIIYPFC